MNYHDKYFTIDEIMRCFSVIDGKKTLGDIDARNVFSRQIPAKGIAGCVIEQSVLGMKQNSLQEADLTIRKKNGECNETELKVTGVIASNKNNCRYEAKEPVSVTAVSIGTIEREEFLNSHFYQKLKHMLFVYYEYKKRENQKTVPYTEYARFPVLGHFFWNLEDDVNEFERFKSDWTYVRDYLKEIEDRENREELYPLLHQSVKKNLFYIDIAPRYKSEPKQTPRFRLKKSYVNMLIQKFCNQKFEHLETEFNSYAELDRKLHNLTVQYKGKTVKELIDRFNISVDEKKGPSKSISEMILVRMLGGSSKTISKIDIFQKIGLIGKTIVITPKGGRTEDMKLFTINLDEIRNSELMYEETSYYEYFDNHQLLCILFQEPNQKAGLDENVFLGFKRLYFEDDLINGTIKKVYDDICDKINNNGLVESYSFTKAGVQRINDTGVARCELNLPKSAEYDIFVRGTSTDSRDKPWKFYGKAADGGNVINTYRQQIWIKGAYITKLLNDIDFI